MITFVLGDYAIARICKNVYRKVQIIKDEHGKFHDVMTIGLSTDNNNHAGATKICYHVEICYNKQRLWVPWENLQLSSRSRPFYGRDEKTSPQKNNEDPKKQRKVHQDHTVPINIIPHSSVKPDQNITYQQNKNPDLNEDFFSEFSRRGNEIVFDNLVNDKRCYENKKRNTKFLTHSGVPTEDKYKLIIDDVVTEKEVHDHLYECWRYNVLCNENSDDGNEGSEDEFSEYDYNDSENDLTENDLTENDVLERMIPRRAILKKEMYGGKVSDEKVTDEEASDKEVSNEERSDKEVSDKKMSDEVSDEKVSDEETSDKVVTDEEASDKEALDKEVFNEESSDKEVSDEKVSDEETSDEEDSHIEVSDDENSDIEVFDDEVVTSDLNSDSDSDLISVSNSDSISDSDSESNSDQDSGSNSDSDSVSQSDPISDSDSDSVSGDNLSESEINVHTSWCSVCGKRDDNLKECPKCPACFHVECKDKWMVTILHRKNLPNSVKTKDVHIRNSKPYSTRTIKSYTESSATSDLCPSCVWGPSVGYGDVVWNKLESCPWWPAKVLTPGNLPSCLLSREHGIKQWPVRYYDYSYMNGRTGTLNHSWSETTRTCLFLPSHTAALDDVDERRDAVMDACDDYISVYLS